MPLVSSGIGSFPKGGHAQCLSLEDRSFWFRHRNSCLRILLHQYPPHGPIFDLGGGNGFVAKALQDAGLETVVVEPSPEGAASARARGLEHVICSTVEAARFRAWSIPAAAMFDVLEHIEDDLGFLRGLHHLMCERARLYITVPAFPLLWSGEDVYAGHFRRHTKRSLAAALESTGFGVERISYFFAPLMLPVLLLRALPHRLGIWEDVVKKSSEHHQPPPGPGTRLLDFLLGVEARALARGSTIPLGSSLLAVARRK